MAAHFLDAFLGASFGGIVTIAITIWLENLRSPSVRLAIGAVVPIPPRGPFEHDWRSLRIEVSNERLPAWANWWLSRLPAQQCSAEISFLRLDGTSFLAEPWRERRLAWHRYLQIPKNSRPRLIFTPAIASTLIWR
jgi:hypothetical protein